MKVLRFTLLICPVVLSGPSHGTGTVLKLGTQRHHDALVPAIDSLSTTGCFALTELGFGEC